MKSWIALACGFSIATAALQYRDITDVTVGDAGYALDVDQDGVSDFDFTSLGSLAPLYVIFNSSVHGIVTISTSQWDVMKPLVLGDSVKASEFYNFGDASLAPNYASSSFPTNVDRYLGLRFSKSSQNYYAWLRVSYNGTAVTLKDLAWNNTPDQSLKAGQMPSSSAMSSSSVAQSSAAISSSVALSSSKPLSSVVVSSSVALSSSKPLSSVVVSSSAALSSSKPLSSIGFSSSAALSSMVMSSSVALSSSKPLSSAALSSSTPSSSSNLSSSTQVVAVAGGVDFPNFRASQLYLPGGNWDLKLWDFSGRLLWAKSLQIESSQWIPMELQGQRSLLDLWGDGQHYRFQMVP